MRLAPPHPHPSRPEAERRAPVVWFPIMANASIGDVLREGLRELRGEVGKMATAADLAAMRSEVEPLGRETRPEWEYLHRDLPAAVAAAVVEAVGPQLRDLRKDVDDLKRCRLTTTPARRRKGTLHEAATVRRRTDGVRFGSAHESPAATPVWHRSEARHRRGPVGACSAREAVIRQPLLTPSTPAKCPREVPREVPQRRAHE